MRGKDQCKPGLPRVQKIFGYGFRVSGWSVFISGHGFRVGKNIGYGFRVSGYKIFISGIGFRVGKNFGYGFRVWRKIRVIFGCSAIGELNCKEAGYIA